MIPNKAMFRCFTYNLIMALKLHKIMLKMKKYSEKYTKNDKEMI